jgi:hypothetical protein
MSDHRDDDRHAGMPAGGRHAPGLGYAAGLRGERLPLAEVLL